MKVHVFGITSSPSCCNYAPKRKAVNNGKKYHPDVETTLQKRFHVDEQWDWLANRNSTWKWNIENDQLGFSSVSLGDKPFTRRGMLSMISKIYVPLGLAAPFLEGKINLQDLCKNNYSSTCSLKKAIFWSFCDFLYMCYNIIQNWIMGTMLNPEIVHDMINLLYYEYWTDKQKYLYVYQTWIILKQYFSNASSRQLIDNWTLQRAA